MPLTNANIIDCSASGVLGTGLAGCKTDRKRVVALGLLQKGYLLDEDITLAYMQQLQQEGKLIYLPGVITFADNTPDDTIVTREGSGLKTVVSKLPYEYLATFDNGYNFQQALKSLSGSQNYDLIIFDVDDQVWFTETRAGNYKGYSLYMHESGNYKGSDGTNAASQTLALQLLDRNEIDERMAVVTDTDFSWTDLDGVNDITITIDPVANAATSIVFTPNLIDGTHILEGLELTDLLVKKNVSGTITTVTPSAISYTTNPGKVTLTVPAVATSQIYTIQLYDGSIPSDIILQSTGGLFKSNIGTVTVA